ncbi:MAG: SdrD B-like domain-containing protein [Clostridia bacterium]
MSKKICSILLLTVLLLNSSVVTIISQAVNENENTQEKISMELSATQLTNKVQNELTITGVLERDSNDDPLYENPVVTFEFPNEVEKVVINDVKLLYDSELKLGEYTVENNENGNKVIKIPFIGKQTKYQTDEISKGTNIIVSVNVLLKQDISTKNSKIKMTCSGALDSSKIQSCEKEIKLVNPSEITTTSILADNNITGEIKTVNGIEVNTKALLGNTELKQGANVYSNEIIKYEITLTNTTEDAINNVKILGNIPEGTVFVDYDEDAFSFWNLTYTMLEPKTPDSNGVYWQDDTYQYVTDETVKTKEIFVGTLQKSETKKYSYEVKVNTTSQIKIDTNIDLSLNDNVIYTYNISNRANPADFEVRMRQYQSRTEKNEFSYDVIVKNLTDQNKSGVITIDIPNNVEITKVDTQRLLRDEDAEYEIKDNKLIIKANDIETKYFKAFSIYTKVNITEETISNKYAIGLDADFTCSNVEYRSNQSIATGGMEAVKITQSSETSGEKIKEFKEITYTYEIENLGYVIDEWGGYSSIIFEDYIPNELKIESVEYNNFDVKKEGKFSETKYTITNENKKLGNVEIAEANGGDNSKSARLKINLNIKNNEKITIKIKTKVRPFDTDKNNVEIANSAMVSGDGLKTKQSNIIQNTLVRPKTTNIITIDPDGNIVDGGDTPTPTPTPTPSENTKAKYSISGLVWIDENENGQRDNEEKAKEGVEVLLYDVTSKKFVTDEKGKTLTKQTDKDGKYTFTNIYLGQYYVIFKYDTDTYNITEYQKSDVDSSQNNDAIEKYARIFNETRTIGMTNTINLNSYRNNIDLGLVEKKNFDLKIEQFIQKVTVTNKKESKEYTYNNKKLAKIAIHSKQFVGSTVVVEYKLKITNVGDLAGKVYEIVDEIPSKMDFHSELNSGWTKSIGYTISNISFANTEINPGESIEATVILSKTLGDQDAGTYTNITKIETSESSKHTSDLNTENDIDKIELIIEVATGLDIAFKVIGGVMMGLLYIALMIYFIKRFVNKKGLFVIFMILVTSVACLYPNKNYAYDVDTTIAGLQESFTQSVQNAYTEAVKAVEPNIKVALGGYKGKSGTGIFYKVEADGSYTPIAGCTTPGSHFNANANCDYVGTGEYDEDGNEKKEWKCEGAYESPELSQVDCVYTGSSQPTVSSGGASVKGDDVPETGLDLSWNAGDGFNLSIGGDMPGSFSQKEASGLWGGISSVVSRTDPGSTSDSEIKSALDKSGFGGDFTTSRSTGSDGITRLSVTLSRTVYVTVTATLTWQDYYHVSENYVCPRCGYSGTKWQEIAIDNSTTVTQTFPFTFQTTMTFEPEELPKTLIIFKVDKDTGEKLYTENDDNTCTSEFRFLVKGDGSEFEIGVGESLTGLHDGTYEIYEIGSAYGYGVWTDNYDKSKYYKKVGEVTLSGSTIFNVVNIENKKEFIDLSGYVWEDMLNGKDNARNNLFQNDQYDDKDKLVPGVKVILHDTVRNRELVTWTNENGEYHFGSRNEDLTYTDDTLRIADLDKYYIEFEYNGVKYRNVKLNSDVNVTNASRASEEVASGKSDEDSSVRQRFNERFSTISSETQIDSNGESTGIVIDANGNVNSDKISYIKNGNHQSQINYGKNMTDANGNKEAYGENIYHIKATTYKNLNLSDYLEGYIKKENTTIVHVNEIKNINLGLYSREQVDVAVDSDVARFVLNVNGYQHTYKYATLVNPDTQEEMDVKLKALKGKYYERQLHESTISYSATPEGVPNLYADITYKIYLQNKSNTLTAKIKELTLNYDEDLKIISYGYEGSNVNTEVSESAITATKNGTGAVQLKEATIDLEKLEDRKISAGKREVLEVTFRTDANTIAKILNNPTGIKFDFMAEVKTYSTYANNEENAFNRAEGIYAYASIDKNSAARNAQVQIDTDDSFVTDTFENDTTIAPTFKLSKGTQTELSGIVYEDSPKESTPIKISGNNIYERVGDGIYNNENVMANVLVELLSVSMENGQYDSDTARTGENGQQAYDVAKLYQENKTTQGESSKVLARTYTNEKGEYKFEGLTAGNYVIKYTYGKNMKDVDENGQEKGTIRSATAIYTSDGKTKLKEIEAREYKSTVITSGEISNAMNITDGKAHLNGDYSWFLKSPETRYSDAVDDVEYRANLEKEAKINYEILKGTKTYVYENMEAYTPYFKLGVEEFNDQQLGATLETQEDGTLNHVFTIDNVDFGLIERPIVDLQVDKVITGLKVSLGNGQVLINGDPSKESLPYVRTGLDDFVPIEMDTELLQNATIEEEYTIKITNNSELDYSIYPIWGTDNTQKVALRRNYYYYGTQEGLSTDEAVTTRIDVLGDYIGSELTADESTMPEWNKRAVEELTSYNGTNLFTTENDGKKEKTLRDGKYTIYTTNTFNNPNEEIVTIGQTKSIAYKVSRLLAVNTDTMKYTNDVEILQYSGYSQNKDRTEENTYNRVKDTTPGNLVPGGAMEDDEDSVRTTITPPTGTIISRWLYVTTVAAGLILVGATIIFIRKRVLVK